MKLSQHLPDVAWPWLLVGELGAPPVGANRQETGDERGCG